MSEKNVVPKFVVIDDDEDVLTVASAILASLGCEVVTAKGGIAGLELLEKDEGSRGVDAIFLDVMMPDVNGIEVLKVLKGRENTRDIPVIMITAQDKGDNIINGYQYGADYYIPKPFNKEQLVFGIDLVLGNDTGSVDQD